MWATVSSHDSVWHFVLRFDLGLLGRHLVLLCSRIWNFLIWMFSRSATLISCSLCGLISRCFIAIWSKSFAETSCTMSISLLSDTELPHASRSFISIGCFHSINMWNQANCMLSGLSVKQLCILIVTSLPDVVRSSALPLYIIWAALKVLYGLSRCHTKRRMDLLLL